MAARDQYIDFVLEQFAPLGEIAARSMMGGYTLYCGGAIFAIIARGAVYLKADDANRPAFEARGLRAFRPFEDKPGVMQYYEAPPEIFEDADALKLWAAGAIAAGERAKSKKKPRKKPAGRV